MIPFIYLLGALIGLTIAILVYREFKNAPLECNKCQYLIPVSKGYKCPSCGFDNNYQRKPKG